MSDDLEHEIDYHLEKGILPQIIIDALSAQGVSPNEILKVLNNMRSDGRIEIVLDPNIKYRKERRE